MAGVVTIARGSLFGCRMTVFLMMPTAFERLGGGSGSEAGLGR
jgi:hypothetical protein